MLLGNEFSFDMLAIEIGGSQSADASAHNHQIILSPVLCGLPDGVPGIAVAQLVRVGVAAIVVAAHAHKRGRIIAGCFFGIEGRVVEGERGAGNHAAADGQRDAVEEVAARDVAVHAEVLVGWL